MAPAVTMEAAAPRNTVMIASIFILEMVSGGALFVLASQERAGGPGLT